MIGGTAPSGQFDFVAVVYDATADGGLGSTTLYVNSNPPVTDSGLPPDGQTVLTIGRNPSFDDPFGGVIDDVFVYNQALNVDQIEVLRNRGVTLPEPAGLPLALGAALIARRRRR